MILDDNAVRKFHSVFSDSCAQGSLDNCLQELSTSVATLLEAEACIILLFSEEETVRAEPADRIGLGILPGTTARLRKARPDVPIFGKSSQKAQRDARESGSMFSTIVLHGKKVGVIQVFFAQRSGRFGQPDLDLFNIVTPAIAKSIQVIQLQQILRSQFAQLALVRTNEEGVRALLTGTLVDPNKIAKTLAKSFYREMLSAGFSFNQILFAATEVISELSASVKRHRSRQKLDNGAAHTTADIMSTIQ